ncbi:hypothetical protein Tco_0914247 [Tanacetum coccineum]
MYEKGEKTMTIGLLFIGIFETVHPDPADPFQKGSDQCKFSRKGHFWTKLYELASQLKDCPRYEKKLVHLEQPLPPTPGSKTADVEAIDPYYELVNAHAQKEVACLMLAGMTPDIQKKNLENYNVYDMLKESKTMFKEQAKQELFETVKAFYACKQEEGQSVSSYLLQMQ